MQSTRPPDESDSGLDRLLAEARWPDPTSEQLTRLRDRWTSLRAKRRGRHYLVPLLSAAAAILLLAIGLIALRTQNDASAPAGPNNQIAGREPTDDEGAELARFSSRQRENGRRHPSSRPRFPFSSREGTCGGFRFATSCAIRGTKPFRAGSDDRTDSIVAKKIAAEAARLVWTQTASIAGSGVGGTAGRAKWL